jgi:hypothetical protein
MLGAAYGSVKAIRATSRGSFDTSDTHDYYDTSIKEEPNRDHAICKDSVCNGDDTAGEVCSLCS